MQMPQTIFQFLRYVLVGGAATVADYGSYYLLTRASGMDSLTANPLSYMAGNVISFLGHRNVTFRSRGRVSSQYLRFICVTVVGIAISQLAIWSLLRLGAHDLVSKAFSVAASGFFNYTANRFWTFKITRPTLSYNKRG
jgi:putative flippase GtrA